MKSIVLLLTAFVLSSCETTPFEQLPYAQQKAYVQKMVDRCLAQGIPLKSPEMKVCARYEFNRDTAVRAASRERASNAGQALAGGLGAYGQALQNNAASYNANRPMNCTTTPQSTFVGGTPSSYRTSCY